tara:strand:+ start:401 stop:1441 length:1041 start_codon:yes stop_codon:yes gene_type:complete
MYSTQSKSFSSGKTSPIIIWSCIGVIFFIVELYIWCSWIFSDNFVPTDTGIDVIPKMNLWYLYGVQLLASGLAFLGLWFWILRPWIREGRLSTDGMLAICCWTLVFFDPSMNYTVTTVLYNSYAVNMGAWTLGSWPSWTSPNGNLLPEPLLVTVPGYLCFVFFMAAFPCWIMKKVKARFPNLGTTAMVALLVLGVIMMDSVIEILLLRTGIYAYPAGIREVTLFAGQTYQFPLTEALTFGGAISLVAILRFFVDDKGQTFVEKGSDKIKIRAAGKQWLKFLALFGFVHFTFTLIFMIPNQWLGTHGDPFPEGYPSYMINDLCKYGDNRDECPGPGISMPRPNNNPW